MQILNFIMSVLFVLFMAFLIFGFNRQMNERAKKREEHFKERNLRKNLEKEKNE